MELLPRYLNAVRNNLPKRSADDILAELSDSIQSRAEEREAELGRPLTIDEEAIILKSFGHPMLVASRYWKQQSLIGPTLLPFYWQTLRIVLPIVLAVTLAATLIIGVANASPAVAFGEFWGAAWGTLFTVVGIVTTIFALIERFAREGDIVKWDPRALPQVSGARVPRPASAIDLIFNGVVAVILAGTPQIRALFTSTPLGPGLIYIAGLPLVIPWWHAMLETWFFTATVQALVSAVMLFRPEWYRLRAAAYVVTISAILVVSVWVLAGGAVVQPGAGPSHVADLATLVTVLHWISISLLIPSCIVCAALIYFYGRQLLPSHARRSMNLGIDGGRAA